MALAVLAALAALTPAAVYFLKPAMDYREAVGGSYRMLHHARSLAIRQGEAVTVSVDLERREVRIEGRAETLRIASEIGLDVTVAGEFAEDGIARFRFYPDGSATGGTMTLRRSGGRQATVTLDWLTGRVRVEGSAGRV
nr:GspH/FimT family protein [Thioalkalivibrio paradoxus]